MFRCLIPVSAGELLDKLTILEIKSERIKDPAKLANVRRELGAIDEAWRSQRTPDSDALADIVRELKAVNEKLWNIEDAIRAKEARGQFDRAFIELARAVYLTNDQRALLKRRLNALTDSELTEEKSYSAEAAYRADSS